jgi:hypothetical protein
VRGSRAEVPTATRSTEHRLKAATTICIFALAGYEGASSFACDRLCEDPQAGHGVDDHEPQHGVSDPIRPGDGSAEVRELSPAVERLVRS